MSKPRNPPPPPDYTQEKRDLRVATEQQYADQANTYNQAVKDYNDQLSTFSGNIANTSGTIGGMGIGDLYDDPTTDINENQFSSLQNTLSGYNTSLSGLATPDKPTFSSVIQSEYGPIGITNIPSLNNLNSNMYNTLTGQVGDLTASLNDLNKQRTAEENRIKSFRNALIGDASNYNTQLGQFGIADLSGMDALDRQLNALDTRRNAFSSSILDQLYPSGFSEYNTSRAGLSSGLADLRNRRQNELDRISGFESALLGDVDTYRDTLGGLTIADADAITNLQNTIADRQRQAGRFSSELGFNFNDELGELSDVSRGVSNLSRDRQTELDRIQSEQERILGSARSAEQAAESGNIYSATGLDAIDDRIRDLRADISGFSSALPSDFGSADSPLTDAETALADLRSRRATELDAIQSGITGATSGLGDLNLYDEDAIRKARADILSQQGDLAAFTGGRVGDIGASATAGLTQVDNRLAELETARNDLETRAQALMEQINNASFYATDDLTSNQSSAEQLQAEVELYKANQAMDEINTLMNRLNSERGRLERDAENVAARERIGRDDILSTIGESGVPEFQNYAGTNPITLEQYLALLASEEENPATTGTMPSAFSRNLGVISV